jgi:hypothetical protein
MRIIIGLSSNMKIKTASPKIIVVVVVSSSMYLILKEGKMVE